MIEQTMARSAKISMYHVVLTSAVTAVLATYAGPKCVCHAFSPQTRPQFATIETHRSLGGSLIPVGLPLTKLNAQRSEQKRSTGSQYGVRRRVRSVLERARSRTGIRNNSEYLDQRKGGNNAKDDDDENGFKIGIDGTSRTGSGSKINRSNVSTAKLTQMKTTGNVKEDNNDRQSQSQFSGPEGGKSSTRKSSIQTVSSVSSVVADAAAIGGFGDEEVNLELKRKVGGNAAQSTFSTKKTNPASTYSPAIKPKPSLEDSLLDTREEVPEIDALKGDVSAAFSMPPPPLPFTLPSLSDEQQRKLDQGERVQYQSDMGREGSGFVVLDVKAPAAVVWECLLDFYSYPQTIPTVRDVQMFTNTHLAEDYFAEEAVERKEYQDGTLATLKHGIPSVTRASFSLSKFRLSIAAIHKYRPHPLGDYMVFTLDPACTNVVLKSAKGVWHTQSNPDGIGEEFTRVWLLCELKVSPLLPQWITDYAAKRAMPRATSWLKPTVETAAELWYKGLKD